MGLIQLIGTQNTIPVTHVALLQDGGGKNQMKMVGVKMKRTHLCNFSCEHTWICFYKREIMPMVLTDD